MKPLRPVLSPILLPVVMGVDDPRVALVSGGGGVSANVLTYNGQPLTFDSENLTYTQSEE